MQSFTSVEQFVSVYYDVIMYIHVHIFLASFLFFSISKSRATGGKPSCFLTGFDQFALLLVVYVLKPLIVNFEYTNYFSK